MTEIQKEFFNRTTDQPETFFRAQISFFENCYRAAHNDGKNYVSGDHIGSHLAYFALSNGLINQKINRKSCLKLHICGPSILDLSRRGDDRFQANEPVGILPSFSDCPLSCMAFSRNADEFSSAFHLNDKVYTAFQAVVTSRQMEHKNKFCDSFSVDGGALEQIVNLAFMIFTHSKGLKVISFAEWFCYFVQQLGCYPFDKFEATAKQIDIGENFIFEWERIPYFGFNCSSWPHKLKKYLHRFRGIQLDEFEGAFKESGNLIARKLVPPTSSLPNGSRKRAKLIKPVQINNTRVFKDPSNIAAKERSKNLIKIQCNFHEDILSRFDARDIVIKIRKTKLDSKINFIVARKVADEIEFKYQEDFFLIAKENEVERGQDGSNSEKTISKSEAKKINQESFNFPYKDLCIYKLVREGTTEDLRNTYQNCLCELPDPVLSLKPLYNCDGNVNIVFILIDLTEIHGRNHLKTCIDCLKRSMGRRYYHD